MSGFYTPKRTRNLFEPGKPFKISRTKLDAFLKCPRCFYLDRRLGVGQPPSFPFTLNSAVDTLLKKEFDAYRAQGKPHPIMTTMKIDAIPFTHKDLDEWRNSLRGGIKYTDAGTGLTLSGGIDDVWVHSNGKLHIVDYKSTSKEGEVNLDAEWQDSYKRQMEIYQWLFRKNSFPVSDIGYFLYCNGKTDRPAFNARIDFDLKLIPYKGDDSWVEGALLEAHDCLMQDGLPESGAECEFCQYRRATAEAENENRLSL
ncbi:MAG: hypothetical protein A2901_04455 [Elusimicrobia bacterium RIFCSPLOWO2_01_FULL_54_10]|nr:MAG: hypothetical protein A2901_04455 [Elusimicrobia bacterium RIFCSPLOWO2_01_FULL_54_10]